MRDADKIILHLCADIGSDTKKYKDAGYKVICIGKEYGNEKFLLGEIQKLKAQGKVEKI